MKPESKHLTSARVADVGELFDDLEGLWERPWFLGLPSGRWMKPTLPAWAPRMDVFRENGELVFKADLPGMKKENIEVSVEVAISSSGGAPRGEGDQQGGLLPRRAQLRRLLPPPGAAGDGRGREDRGQVHRRRARGGAPGQADPRAGRLTRPTPPEATADLVVSVQHCREPRRECQKPGAGCLPISGWSAPAPSSSSRSGSPSPAAAPSATSRPPPWSGTSLPQVSDTPG